MKNKKTKLVDIIIKNMSKDLESMKIRSYNCYNTIDYLLDNSIAHIYIDELCGAYGIEIKDPESLEINNKDLYEEYSEEVTTRKWWMSKPKTTYCSGIRPILNKEDILEIILKLTDVYNEYEHNRLTSIMKKININSDDINFLKQYFRK